MRIRISTNMTWARYIFGAITIVLLYDIFKILTPHLDVTLRVQIEFVLAFITGTSFYYFSQRKDVEFDSKTLYILWKKKETKIPLTHVRKVRLTIIKINNRPTWKIDYKDKDGINQNVRLIPNKHNEETFENFKTHIKEVNPNVKVENEARSI